MLRLFFSSFVLFFTIENVQMHSYHLGACPTIGPIWKLNMNKMFGIWYVIEQTTTVSSCIVYNITRTDYPGEYKLDQIYQQFILASTPFQDWWHYTGTLKVPDANVPAQMTAEFPLSSSSFTVFATDYLTYAGIFTCQKLPFAHRQSVSILSRTKTLDKSIIDKIRIKLVAAKIVPFELIIIDQNNCPNMDGDIVYHKVGDELNTQGSISSSIQNVAAV